MAFGGSARRTCEQQTINQSQCPGQEPDGWPDMTELSWSKFEDNFHDFLMFRVVLWWTCWISGCVIQRTHTCCSFVPLCSKNGVLCRCVDSRQDVIAAFVLTSLVALQDHEEFSSHRLNKDVWSNETILTLLRGNFIFWQRNKTMGQARQAA